jgi:hypothetical protein
LSRLVLQFDQLSSVLESARIGFHHSTFKCLYVTVWRQHGFISRRLQRLRRGQGLGRVHKYSVPIATEISLIHSCINQIDLVKDPTNTQIIRIRRSKMHTQAACSFLKPATFYQTTRYIHHCVALKLRMCYHSFCIEIIKQFDALVDSFRDSFCHINLGKIFTFPSSWDRIK